jgi:hypothetical protein
MVSFSWATTEKAIKRKKERNRLLIGFGFG